MKRSGVRTTQDSHLGIIGKSLWEETGIPQSGLALHHAISEGFPINWMKQLASRLGIPMAHLAALIQISPSTFGRRVNAGRLSTRESDSLYLVTRLVELCAQLFEGDFFSAWGWMQTSHPALGGHRPIELLQTYAGMELVENFVGRLEHGVVT